MKPPHEMNKQLLLAHGRPLRIPAGEIVFRSDDGNEMFIVLEGVVEIFLEQGERRESRASRS